MVLSFTWESNGIEEENVKGRKNNYQIYKVENRNKISIFGVGGHFLLRRLKSRLIAYIRHNVQGYLEQEVV